MQARQFPRALPTLALGISLWGQKARKLTGSLVCSARPEGWGMRPSWPLSPDLGRAGPGHYGVSAWEAWYARAWSVYERLPGLAPVSALVWRQASICVWRLTMSQALCMTQGPHPCHSLCTESTAFLELRLTNYHLSIGWQVKSSLSQESLL